MQFIYFKKENYVSKKENSPNQWHPAATQAWALELYNYKNSLEFFPEFQLTTGSLSIDILIIKKVEDVVIKKNIASIFRKANIIEYKSPTHSVSIKDFFKVYSYAYLYISDYEGIESELTITFISNRKPIKLFKYLEKEKKYMIEKKSNGIYYIYGDIIAIQVIESSKLSVEENIWLKELSNKLDMQGFQKITGEIDKLGTNVRVKAYLQAILEANKELVKERGNMTQSLRRILEESGITKEWEKRGIAEGKAAGIALGEKRGMAAGEKRGKTKIAKNLVAKGFEPKEVAELTMLDLKTVKKLY
jgi:hypothetical protein